MVQAWYGHIWTKFWCFKYVDKVNLSTFSEYRHKLSIWADMECVGWETTVECSLSCLQGRLISPTPNPLKSSRIRLSATFAKLSAVPPQRMRINRRGNLGGALTRSLRENPFHHRKSSSGEKRRRLRVGEPWFRAGVFCCEEKCDSEQLSISATGGRES